MAQMRLTLIGLYNYDPTLFDQMVMPAGVDSDLVKNTILQKTGEFELIYTNLDYMKNMIGFWSNKHLRTFTKWNEALNIEYDPLYNYDRMEEITIGRKGSDSRSENSDLSASGSETTGTTGSDSKGGTTKSETKGSTSPAQTTTTKTNTVAAYDSSTYQPKEQTTESIVLNTAGSDSTDSEGSYNEVNQRRLDESKTNSNSEYINKNAIGQHTEDETHTAHLYGNIGVTTSQQMLQSELDIARFNLYEQIADLFVEDFCIMIY